VAGGAAEVVRAPLRLGDLVAAVGADELVTTACPIPADASTTTDSVVAARMAQRGFFGRTGGRGRR
jgi:hypothetical protein